jgi:hypothetical protein
VAIGSGIYWPCIFIWMFSSICFFLIINLLSQWLLLPTDFFCLIASHSIDLFCLVLHLMVALF